MSEALLNARQVHSRIVEKLSAGMFEDVASRFSQFGQTGDQTDVAKEAIDLRPMHRVRIRAIRLAADENIIAVHLWPHAKPRFKRSAFIEPINLDEGLESAVRTFETTNLHLTRFKSKIREPQIGDLARPCAVAEREREHRICSLAVLRCGLKERLELRRGKTDPFTSEPDQLLLWFGNVSTLARDIFLRLIEIFFQDQF